MESIEGRAAMKIASSEELALSRTRPDLFHGFNIFSQFKNDRTLVNSYPVIFLPSNLSKLWCGLFVIVFFGLFHFCTDSAAASSAPKFQDPVPAAEKTEKGGTDSNISTPASGDTSSDGTAEKRTMLQMMFTGNPLGITTVILILLLSVASAILVIESMLSIRRTKLIPPSVLHSLESTLALKDVRGAMTICNDADNYSMLTHVVLAGLERFRSSEFGFAEYRSAVEEAGEHFTGRLYRKIEMLNVIASVAPMLGLTGTVIGMIDAFNTIAANQGAAGPEALASGIGQALITTLLGLVVAIPTMVAFSFFRSRIDSLVSEAGTKIERIMLPLSRKKSR